MMNRRQSLSLVALVASIAAISVPGTGAAVEKGEDWPRGATWSGSALGGAHYVFGTAMSQVVSNYLETPVAVEATGGPWQNVDLANKGDTDFIPVPSALLHEAYRGLGKAEGTQHKNLRAVMPMFPQYLHWWTLPDSGIDSYDDLSGKHVDMSGPGSFLNDYGRKLFAMFEVEPGRITNLTNFADSNSMLADGQLDAAAAWSGIPAPPASEMASTRDAIIFGVPQADAEQFAQEYPGVFPAVIPAGTYEGQTEPVETLALWTFVVTRKDLSEDFVYNVVKTTFAHKGDLVTVFKAAKDTEAENVQYAPIPLHKGAYRFYQEQGIAIPNAAMPID